MSSAFLSPQFALYEATTLPPSRVDAVSPQVGSTWTMLTSYEAMPDSESFASSHSHDRIWPSAQYAALPFIRALTRTPPHVGGEASPTTLHERTVCSPLIETRCIVRLCGPCGTAGVLSLLVSTP